MRIQLGASRTGAQPQPLNERLDHGDVESVTGEVIYIKEDWAKIDSDPDFADLFAAMRALLYGIPPRTLRRPPAPDEKSPPKSKPERRT
jgi:hypothetical protein